MISKYLNNIISIQINKLFLHVKSVVKKISSYLKHENVATDVAADEKQI